MKKITSLLLVCVMVISMSFSAAAWAVPSTAVEVPQSNGMTYAQLNAELSGAEAYDWRHAVSISGDANGSGCHSGNHFRCCHLAHGGKSCLCSGGHCCGAAGGCCSGSRPASGSA